MKTKEIQERQIGHLYKTAPAYGEGVVKGLGVPVPKAASRNWIKAHATVAAPGYTVKEGKARLGNYNHFIGDDRRRGIL